MASHLGSYFREQRIEKGWSLGDLARLIGYRNMSKGANKICRFERDGAIKEELLARLAEVLEINLPTVEQLIEQDRQEYLGAWEAWVNEPVPMQLVVKYMPGVYARVPLPEHLKSSEHAEAYACELAKRIGKNVCLAVSRRLSIWINEHGEIYSKTEAKPFGGPNIPYMALKSGKKFLFSSDQVP